MKNENDWIDGFPGMISVCDAEGKILVMNKKIADYFASTSGKKLIGSSMFDCHGAESGAQVRQLLADQKTSVYTTGEQDGSQELVIHAPWFKDGQFAGLVEISLPFQGEIRRNKHP